MILLGKYLLYPVDFPLNQSSEHGFPIGFPRDFTRFTFDSRRATQRSYLKTRTGVRQFTEVGRDQSEVSTFPQVIWGVQLQLVLDGWIYI